jgi:flagellar hook-associated protein 1
VNAVHSASVGIDGSTGNNFFAPPAQRSGAAKAMAVSAAVKSNHDLIATAGVGEGPTGSSGVVALTGLGDAKVAGGGKRTFLDEGIRLIVSVGTAAASSNTARTAASAQVQSLAGLRDSASGVSQEDELTRLSAFQNVAAASIKFVATVNDMLTNLITNL